MKKFDVKRMMNKDIVYGSLLELAKNKDVFYHSTVDPRYSHFTDHGKDAILAVIEEMFRGLKEIEIQEIKEQAKKQTMDALR
jgi:hypothetical protein